MVLKMPRPTQRKPGTPFYFRVRVPADVRAALGKNELSYSLGTSDETEAKRRFAADLARHTSHWDAIRKGPQPLDLRTTVALCGEVYREWVGAIEAEPGPVTIWATLAEKNAELSATQGEARRSALEGWYGTTADDVLSRHGVLPDVASRDRLLEQIHDTVARASGTLHRRAEGDYDPDPHESRYPASVSLPARPERPSKSDEGVTLTSLFGEWEKQARADRKPEKTIRDFRHKVDNLVAFLGHGRVQGIAPADVVRCTDHLREDKGLSGKTIGQKYLAVLRLMFNYAKSRAKGIPEPTDGIVIKAPKRQTTREKGFTDAEARSILTAAKAGVGVPDRMSEAMRRAIRWVPWICSHTGARVTEITQLRKEDVQTIDGTPCLRITHTCGGVCEGGQL